MSGVRKILTGHFRAVLVERARVGAIYISTWLVATISGMVTLTTMDDGKMLKLTNVLYAPEFKQNIINISRIIDKGNKVYV